jgi:hypothetical protein
MTVYIADPFTGGGPEDIRTIDTHECRDEESGLSSELRKVEWHHMDCEVEIGIDVWWESLDHEGGEYIYCPVCGVKLP